MQQQLLGLNALARCMDYLREGSCAGREELLVMLLANLTSLEAGAEALLQMGRGALEGLNAAMLIKLLLDPPGQQGEQAAQSSSLACWPLNLPSLADTTHVCEIARHLTGCSSSFLLLTAPTKTCRRLCACGHRAAQSHTVPQRQAPAAATRPRAAAGARLPAAQPQRAAAAGLCWRHQKLLLQLRAGRHSDGHCSRNGGGGCDSSFYCWCFNSCCMLPRRPGGVYTACLASGSSFLCETALLLARSNCRLNRVQALTTVLDVLCGITAKEADEAVREALAEAVLCLARVDAARKQLWACDAPGMLKTGYEFEENRTVCACMEATAELFLSDGFEPQPEEGGAQLGGGGGGGGWAGVSSDEPAVSVSKREVSIEEVD